MEKIRKPNCAFLYYGEWLWANVLEAELGTPCLLCTQFKGDPKKAVEIYENYVCRPHFMAIQQYKVPGRSVLLNQSLETHNRVVSQIKYDYSLLCIDIGKGPNKTDVTTPALVSI